MGHKEKQQKYGTRRSEVEAKVITEVGTQTLGDYIDNWQATAAKGVVLRPIMEICDR